MRPTFEEAVAALEREIEDNEQRARTCDILIRNKLNVMGYRQVGGNLQEVVLEGRNHHTEATAQCRARAIELRAELAELMAAGRLQ